PLSVEAGVTLPLPGDPKVEVHWADLTQAFDPATDLKFPDVGDALNFDKMSFADILAAFHKLVDYLNGLSSFGFLKEKLPLINKSVSDILNFAGKVGDDVEKLSEVLTVQKLHQLIL